MKSENGGETWRSDPPSIQELLDASVEWSATGDAVEPYVSHVGQDAFTVRINDFPESPLYTLFVNGVQLGDFDEWPSAWLRPHESDPVLFSVRESEAFAKPLNETTLEWERRLILSALERAKGDVAAAAERLQIGSAALAQKLKEHNMAR
jgi:DNA-binding NtrC family response regulator